MINTDRTDTYMNHDEEYDRGHLDFERIQLLFNVIAQAVLHGPAFTNITAEAQFELQAINADALNMANERQKAKVAADNKIIADQKARADELAAEQEQKLRDEAKQKIDDDLKTQAQILAANQAKAEADAKAQVNAKAAADALLEPVTPVVPPVVESAPQATPVGASLPAPFATSPANPSVEPPFVSPSPESTFPTDPVRRV
jgi:hypothetical protein